MQSRASQRLTVLCVLALSASWLLACGGRYRSIHEEDDGAAGTSGAGSSGRAGAANAGRGGVTGGAGQGASGKGGSSSGVGGACSQLGCPSIDCGPGFVFVLRPGQCCPTCEADPAACLKGMQSYEMDREAIVQKAAYGCNKDVDCRLVYTDNQCESDCRAAAVFSGVFDYFLSSLAFSAEQYCQTCPPSLSPPCDPPAWRLACVNGQCAVRQ